MAAVEDDGRLVVTVADDGRGGADPTPGSGLRGLSDRLAAIDGTADDRQPARRRHDRPRRASARRRPARHAAAAPDVPVAPSALARVRAVPEVRADASPAAAAVASRARWS